MQSIKYAICINVSLLVSFSCSGQYPLNYKSPGKYEFNYGEQANNNPNSLFLILVFSGGGTRAASLAYGTLEELKNIEIPEPNAPSDIKRIQRTMLDDVKVISAVSGGSFTAAYYGLHGHETFNSFRERFLLKDVQGDLFWKFINPFNWPRLMSSRFGRSDLAQEYYDEILFDGATLSDMTGNNRPIISIIATDVVEGEVFPFLPEIFGLICSDYSRFPVSRAVAASSAVPGPLSPIILKNYAGECKVEKNTTTWVSNALETPNPYSRSYKLAVAAAAYLDQKAKPYIYLVDGGISDNLGLRSIIDRINVNNGIREALTKAHMEGTRRIAFIIVDAETKMKPTWHLSGEVPGLGDVLKISSDIVISRYNYETIDLLRRNILKWKGDDTSTINPLDLYFVHLTFNSLPDKVERDFYHNIPTSFSLDQEQVDKLRQIAAKLLYLSSEFQRLIYDMRARVKKPTKEIYGE